LVKRLLREDLEQRDLRMAKKLERDELVNTDEMVAKMLFDEEKENERIRLEKQKEILQSQISYQNPYHKPYPYIPPPPPVTSDPLDIPEITTRDYMMEFKEKLKNYSLHKLFNGKVTVKSVVNIKLVNNFEEKWAEIKDKYDFDPTYSSIEIGFHGTASKNIDNICRIGLVVPGTHGVGHATDTGWYGKGIYLSPNAGLSVGYCREGGKLLVCAVIMGKRSLEDH